MCAYQRVRNNSLSENFAYALNGRPPTLREKLEVKGIKGKH